MITLSTRNVFLGVHVTPAVKTAIKTAAFEQEMAMSEFSYKVLCDALRAMGYDLRTGKKRGGKK